jgi:hypothetical protein
MFCAVGASIIATSINGETWVNRSTSYTLTDICWSGELGYFVGTASNAFIISTDGINWSSVAKATSEWKSITYSPKYGKFVACASSGTASQMVATSRKVMNTKA